MLRRFDLLAVPGEEGVAYTRLILGQDAASPEIAYLPNIVDERVFAMARDTRRAEGRRLMAGMGIRSEEHVALWPARLIEDKGILPFLQNLAKVGCGRWRVLLIGDGPLKEAVDREIASLGVGRTVVRHSSVRYEQMPALYAAADLFLLPSLHDPNPLSVVEAMHSGLPVMLSNRVGNFPEALRADENGWSYTPDDPEMACDTLRAALSTPVERLRLMGGVSRGIASKHWNTQKAVGPFVESVIRLGVLAR